MLEFATTCGFNWIVSTSQFYSKHFVFSYEWPNSFYGNERLQKFLLIFVVNKMQKKSSDLCRLPIQAEQQIKQNWAQNNTNRMVDSLTDVDSCSSRCRFI